MHINKKKILVTGGAGYIGSHMVLTLNTAGYHVIVLDNLSKGHRHAVIGADFIHGDVKDPTLLNELFANYQIDAVLHFAGCIEVNESIKNPDKYYDNNLHGTLILVQAMIAHGIKHLVFSSTAAVYGEPEYTPIDELHPLKPINPYGKSKWMAEEIIQDFAKSFNLSFAILRYFNAAGTDPLNRIGEEHNPETHLIPLLLKTALGFNKEFKVFGNTYETKDGTCIRDYIHIVDLCDAHLLALEKIFANDNSFICNLGVGLGFSVLEVIEMVKKITSCSIPYSIVKKREGDPAILVADASYARRILNWKPKYSQLNIIIQDAWNYMLKQHQKVI